jgi:hypothetical protein
MLSAVQGDRKGRIANMPPVLCWRGLADHPPDGRAQALRVPAPQKTSMLAAIASRTIYGFAVVLMAAKIGVERWMESTKN